MNEKENKQLKSFISYYKEQHVKISSKEKEIKALSDDMNSLLNNLIDKRDEEERFIKKLKEKYGESVIKSQFSKLSIIT